jgi:putative membrane protein
MPWIVGMLILWLITAASLYIISKLPFIGVEISSPQKALISAAVFGILSVILQPILGAIFIIPNLLTLFLLRFVFSTIANAIIFGLAAYLVEGFRLRKGFISALLGAIALSLVSTLIAQLLGSLGLQVST